MKKHNSNDKRPRPHALAPREHYVKKNGSFKPKMAFENEASALNWIESHKYFKMNNAICYPCSVCGKFHISIHYSKEELARYNKVLEDSRKDVDETREDTGKDTAS